MVLYYLRANGTDYPIRVVNNQTFGGEQSVIVYEAPGTNGGVVVVTGRTNNSITMSGKLLAESSPPLLDLNTKKNIFLNMKDKGTPVVLIAPIDNNDTGRYVIGDFSGNLVEGQPNYLSFSMKLIEYRQANLKRSTVNLISYAPAEEFKKILTIRQQGG